METFHQVIEIAPRNGLRYQRVITIAGTDAAYTVLPSALLEMVGVNPEWHAPFAIPGHQRQNLPMAEVRIRIGNQERTTVCVFGESDGEPVLGSHTLAAFGLKVDLATKSLVSVDLSP
jgi:predicted aspartyl protease